MRALPIEERQPLLDTSNSAWDSAFANYLSTCGCPLLEEASAFDRQHLRAYVHWLVGHAIAMLFEDKGAKIACCEALELCH